MDVQRYISSGIIESYVAGLVSEQEAKELQEAMLQYPEVKQAVDACQQDMERYVQMFSLQPPKVVKEKIFELINSDDLVGQVTAEDATEKSTSPAMKAYTVASEFPEEEHTDGARSWRWVAAAAIILLLISAGFNYKLYTDKSELDSKYQALQVEQSTLMAKKPSISNQVVRYGQYDALDERSCHQEGHVTGRLERSFRLPGNGLLEPFRSKCLYSC